jgi:hypothetical protein
MASIERCAGVSGCAQSWNVNRQSSRQSPITNPQSPINQQSKIDNHQ